MKKSRKETLPSVNRDQWVTISVIARKFREDKEFRTKVIPNKKKCQKKNLEDYLD